MSHGHSVGGIDDDDADISLFQSNDQPLDEIFDNK
jgi:hypothetical protein